MDVTLTGKLLPWGENGQPVLLRMPACDDFFLPLFSAEEDLRLVLGRNSVPFAMVKEVNDGSSFLSSLPFIYGAPGHVGFLRVILDLRFTDEGRVRFIEIKRAAEEVG